MKTQITKSNALIIIESALRQQTLCRALGSLLDADTNEFNASLGIFEALFNVDFNKMEQKEYRKYWNAFFSQVGSSDIDYEERAEIVYDKVFRLSLKTNKEKKTNPGVISLLSGKNYNISGDFSLET